MSNPKFYPTPPPQIVKYNQTGGKISLNINMDSHLHCDYLFRYMDEIGVKPPYIEVYGSNDDPLADVYTLAKPNANERIVWCSFVLNQLDDHDDDDYNFSLSFLQDGVDLTGSPLSTGNRTISTDGSHFIMIARLVPLP